MAKSCTQCGRGYLKAMNRSHSNIATIRRQQVNLQSRIIDGERVRICTSCMRTAAKKATE